MAKNAHKTRAAVQSVFLILIIILAVIWCDELRRGTNDSLIPALILIFMSIVVLTALPIALYGDFPGGAVWTYGPFCLATIVIGGLLITHNINSGASLFPSPAALERLISEFSLANLYRVVADSWILALLHIVAAAAGVLSIYGAARDGRSGKNRVS